MMAAATDIILPAATQPEPTPTLSLPPKYCEASATDRSVLAAASPTSKCLFQAQLQQPQHLKEACPSGLKGSDKSGTSTSAAGAVKLSRSTPRPCVRNRLMISRRKLFYNFHFSKMVGLPNDHSLATCGATINGARRLFHQVFTHGGERGGNGWHSTQQQHPQHQHQQQDENNVEEAQSAERIPRLRRRQRKSCVAAIGTASRQRIDKLC